MKPTYEQLEQELAETKNELEKTKDLLKKLLNVSLFLKKSSI